MVLTISSTRASGQITLRPSALNTTMSFSSNLMKATIAVAQYTSTGQRRKYIVEQFSLPINLLQFLFYVCQLRAGGFMEYWGGVVFAAHTHEVLKVFAPISGTSSSSVHMVYVIGGLTTKDAESFIAFPCQRILFLPVAN